jgi:hypothetical protein
MLDSYFRLITNTGAETFVCNKIKSQYWGEKFAANDPVSFHFICLASFCSGNKQALSGHVQFISVRSVYAFFSSRQLIDSGANYEAQNIKYATEEGLRQTTYFKGRRAAVFGGWIGFISRGSRVSARE